MWAVDRVVSLLPPPLNPAGSKPSSCPGGHTRDEDIAANVRIGEAGRLIPRARVLTHCNAGELATVSGGTASP